MSKPSSNDKRGQLIGLSLFALCGFIAAAVGIVLISARISDKKRCTEPVPAVVIDLRSKYSGKAGHRHITYAPVFKYEYGGKTYTYVSRVSSRPAAYSRGDTTTLMIDPDDPNVVFVPNDKPERLIIIVCLAFGVIFATFGGIGIVKTISGTRKKETIE